MGITIHQVLFAFICYLVVVHIWPAATQILASLFPYVFPIWLILIILANLPNKKVDK